MHERDWDGYVRERLRLNVRPERETEIVHELALQLSQAYSEFLNSGVSEAEALRRAEAQAGEWDVLAGESTPPRIALYRSR